MNGRICSAPSAQFVPTLNGRACSIEIQNASSVWPESVRPLWSVIVTEIIRGMSGATSRTAAIAALAFSVSKIVSSSSRSTPPSTRPRTAVAYPSRISSKEVAR